MLITDVIREADNEPEIFFLLTAYVEAVNYCDKLDRLPDPIKDLPFVGAADVRARLELLEAVLADAFRRQDDPDRPIVREAMEIFSAALSRLEALEGIEREAVGELPIAA